MSDVDAAAPDWAYDSNDWDVDPPSVGLAIGAGVGGSLVIAVGGWFGLRSAGLEQDFGTAAGILAGAALVLALLAAFTALRRHGLAVKLVVAVLFLAAAGATALAVHGAHRQQRLKEDFRTITQLKVTPEGELEVPPGAETRGPVSRAFITYFRAMLGAAHEQDEALEALGIDKIGDPEAVRRNPALLANCTKIESSAGPLVEAKNAKLHAGYDAFRAAIKAADIPEAVKRGTLSTGPQTRDNFDRLKGLETQLIEGIGTSCRVLARRNWRVEQGQYAFTSMADLNEFNRNGARVQSAARAITTLQDQSLARLREGQAMIARELR